MPKPIPLSVILRTLRKEGFFLVRQKGSHARYKNEGHPTRFVTLKTTEKEIPYGTFKSILLQSGVSEKDFYKK